MKDLLAAFQEYANKNKMSYANLAARLEQESVASDVMVATQYEKEISTNLRRLINSYTTDARLDTFCSSFTRFGVLCLNGIGEGRVLELEAVMQKLGLSFKPMPKVIGTTKLSELGMSPGYVSNLEKIGVTNVTQFLNHKRVGSPTKKLLESYM